MNNNTENKIRERIKLILEEKGRSINSISKNQNEQRNLNRQINEGTTISSVTISKIKSTFQDVNLEWIFTGKGEMLKSEEGGFRYLESDNSIYHYSKTLEKFLNIFKQKIKHRYSIEDFSYLIGDNDSYKEIKFPENIAMPMFCFCDIPLERHRKHMSNYGTFGIGLSKDWAKKNNISPVLYTYPESLMSAAIKIILDLYYPHETGNKKISFAGEEEESLFKKVLSFLLMLCKPYDSNDGYCYYDEKEWRHIPLEDDINYSIAYPVANDDTIAKFKNRIKDWQERIDSNEGIRLSFSIDDITHIILPTEEKKVEFLGEIAKIDEYQNDMDKISNKIIIGNKNMKNSEMEEDKEKSEMDAEYWKDRCISLYNENKVLYKEKDKLNEEIKEVLRLSLSLKDRIEAIEDVLMKTEKKPVEGGSDASDAQEKPAI
jgi:hypothetical protein